MVCSCKRRRPPVRVPAGVVQGLFRDGSGLLTAGRAARSAATGAAAARATGSGSTGTASTWAWELQGTIFHGFDGSSLFGFVERAILVGVVGSEGFVELRGTGGDHFAGGFTGGSAFRASRGRATFRLAFGTTGRAAGAASGRTHFERTVVDGRSDFLEFSGFQFAVLVGVKGREGGVALAELGDGFGGRRALGTAAALATGTAWTAAAWSFRSLGLCRGDGEACESQREDQMGFHGFVLFYFGLETAEAFR
jgi:hypothetical protein